MNNVAAPFWNRIAQVGPLRTSLGRTYFHLNESQLTEAMSEQAAELKAKGVDPEVALAYQKLAPQVAEKEAIDRYSRHNPTIRGALPEITSLNEALLLAIRSYRLNETQTKQLRELLIEAMQPYGARNTLFTAEAAQAARERLRAKLGTPRPASTRGE